MTGSRTSSKRAIDSSANRGPAKAGITPAGTAEWLEMMTESGRFIAQRMEEEVKAQQAFLKCRTPADVMRVQADYYRTAVGQYSAEAARILGILSSVTRVPLAAPRSMFARSYDDVPL